MPDWSDKEAARRAGTVPGYIGQNTSLTDAPRPIPGAGLEGTSAQRALIDPSTFTGLYNETDTGQIWRSDGSSWARFGTYVPVDAVVSKTANYTAHAGEYVLCDTTTAGFTVTLPASPIMGQLVGIKKTSSDVNAVTISPNVDGGVITVATQNHSLFVEYDGAAWRARSGHYPKGVIVASSMGTSAVADGSYTLRLLGPPLNPSGARGIDLRRSVNGSTAINFGSIISGVERNDWTVGLDLELTYPGSVNSHLVLAYDGVKSADVIRLSSGPHVEIANTVGPPDETCRLNLATYEGTSVPEHSTLVSMLNLHMAATSTATYFIRGFSAAEKFTVLRSGFIGINLNGSTPQAPFHAVSAADAAWFERGASADSIYLNFHQGNGASDWRLGFLGGVDDLVLYAANGALSTAAAPGSLRMRVTQAGAWSFLGTAIGLGPVGGTADRLMSRSSSGLVFTATNTALTPIIVRGQTGQSGAGAGDLQQWQFNGTTTTKSAVVAGGTFLSDDNTQGIILKDSAAHYWRVTVSAAGALTTTDLGTTRPTA